MTTESMLNARATFSVQHLLDMRDHKSVTTFPHFNQHQPADDDDVPAGTLSQLSSVIHDDPLMIPAHCKDVQCVSTSIRYYTVNRPNRSLLL